MADKKISELTTLLAADVATNDVLPIVDSSAIQTKKLTAGDLRTFILPDGDKGNITVSASGATWTIDNSVVTYAKIQNVSVTDRLLGRSTAGAGIVEEIICTAAGRALIDDVDATAQRTTLGLIIGTNVQAFNSNLTTYATTAPTVAGLALLDDADASAQRTTLGLGTAATTNSTAYATAAQGALADTAQQESYATLATGATAMALATNNVAKVTPNATATYTSTVPAAGTRASIIILTSGVTSYTITFGTGFRTTGTLATGTVTARLFVIDFISDGTNLLETGRTAAYAA